MQNFVYDEENLVRMKQFLDLEERMTEEYNFLDEARVAMSGQVHEVQSNTTEFSKSLKTFFTRAS